METRIYHKKADKINSWGITLKIMGIIILVLGVFLTIDTWANEKDAFDELCIAITGLFMIPIGAFLKAHAEVVEVASRQLDAMQPKKEEEKTE